MGEVMFGHKKKCLATVNEMLFARPFCNYQLYRLAKARTPQDRRKARHRLAFGLSLFMPRSQAATVARSSNDTPFTLDSIEYEAEQFRQRYTFEKCDVPFLTDELGFRQASPHADGQWRTKSGCVFTPEQAFMTIAGRFANTVPLWQLNADIIPRSSSAICEMFNEGVDYLDEEFCKPLFRIEKFKDYLPLYRDAILEKTAHFNTRNCVGFIDGTFLVTGRPMGGLYPYGIHQQVCYSGNHRSHGIIYQAIQAPDGLMIDVHGPECGRHHDMFMVHRGNLLPRMQALHQQTGVLYTVYGDRAYYGAYPYIRHGWRRGAGVVLTPAQLAEGTTMSRPRVAVEWGFGEVLGLWPYMNEKEGLELLRSQVGKWYRVAVLLTNLHTCLYGNETNSAFNLPALGIGGRQAVHEYLALK